MSELFDDLSRVVGSSLPRREALRLVASALAGAALTPLVFWRNGASASTTLTLQGTGCCVVAGRCQETTEQYCAFIAGKFGPGAKCCDPDKGSCFVPNGPSVCCQISPIVCKPDSLGPNHCEFCFEGKPFPNLVCFANILCCDEICGGIPFECCDPPEKCCINGICVDNPSPSQPCP